MKVLSLNRINTLNAQSFCAKSCIEGPKADEFRASTSEINLFYINMLTYDKNPNWAMKMLKTRDEAAFKINFGEDFKDILSFLENKMPEINEHNLKTKQVYGQKRDMNCVHPLSYRIDDIGRGKEYLDTYLRQFFINKTKKVSAPRQYPDASTCTIYKKDWNKVYVYYGFVPDETSDNIEFIEEEYNKLKSLKNPKLNEINKSVATIHWLMAQATPYQAGSDSMANLLTKAIYKAYDIQISPVKMGKSFDFEAFYRSLDSFIKIYPSIFEQKPHF